MYNPQLETFLRAADCGSFSKAAEAAFITTTAVIKQINLLEGELGVRLFHRSHRGLKLTRAGESLYRDAKYIIQFSKEAVIRAQNAMEQSESIVRIGTSPMTPTHTLMELWPQIHSRCPELKFQLVSFENTPENAREILRNLGQRIDVVPGIFDDAFLRDRQCEGFELYRKPLTCTMSLDHPLAGRDSLTIGDLYHENVMLIRPGWIGHMDELRSELQRHPQIRIINFDFFDLEVFNRCENSRDLLITTPTTENPHPLLTTVPVEWDHSVPFGLLHSPQPSEPVRLLLDTLSEILADSARNDKNE